LPIFTPCAVFRDLSQLHNIRNVAKTNIRAKNQIPARPASERHEVDRRLLQHGTGISPGLSDRRFVLEDPEAVRASELGKPWEFRSVSIGLTDAPPRDYSASSKVYKVETILYLPHPFVTNPCLGFCVLRESRKMNTQNSYRSRTK
jgi:hypothetical protein